MRNGECISNITSNAQFHNEFAKHIIPKKNYQTGYA